MRGRCVEGSRLWHAADDEVRQARVLVVGEDRNAARVEVLAVGARQQRGVEGAQVLDAVEADAVRVEVEEVGDGRLRVEAVPEV